MIRIAISGQFDNDSKIAYTYPDKCNRANPTDKDKDKWLESLADPRDARVFNATEIFALWRSPYGNYYAIFFQNKKDSRGGWTMITLSPGRERFCDGNDVVSALRGLKDLVVDLKWDCNKIKDTYIEEIIKTLNTKTENDASVFPSKTSKDKAYRVYDGEEELKLILQFPDQLGYNNFKRILIVPNATDSKELTPSYDYTRITERPKGSYTIQQPIPEGVSVDKIQYREGETIRVSYTKSGYQTQQHKFTADSKNNSFAEYDGYRIKLKSAEEANIRFQRTLSLCVTSKSTNRQIQDWKVDNSCKRDGETNTIVFSQDNTDYNISISAQGYKTTKIHITNDDLKSGSKSIKLEPNLQAINITLIIKNKQEVPGTIYISSDSPLISEIKPNSRISINKSYISEGGKNNRRNEPPKGPKPEDSTLKSILKGALVTLVSLYLFYLLYCACFSQTPWPFNSEEDLPKTEINTETDNSFSSSETYSEEESQKEEENDRTYLKENNTWKKSDLKSDTYRTFLDHILNGQINEAINNPYSNYDVSSINGDWKAIVENINELKKSSEYASDIKPKIEQAMKRASNHDSINLQELKNEIISINKQYKDTKRGTNSSKKETTSSMKVASKSSQQKATQPKKTTTEKKNTKKPTSDD